jgi:nucleoside diphosphate-linked moiety X motif protein 19
MTIPCPLSCHCCCFLQWTRPEKLLEHHRAGELWLPPPQHYEVGKLTQYHTIESLNAAAGQGEFTCDTCFLPVMIPVADGMLFVLPGTRVNNVSRQFC